MRLILHLYSYFVLKSQKPTTVFGAYEVMYAKHGTEAAHLPLNQYLTTILLEIIKSENVTRCAFLRAIG